MMNAQQRWEERVRTSLAAMFFIGITSIPLSLSIFLPKYHWFRELMVLPVVGGVVVGAFFVARRWYYWIVPKDSDLSGRARHMEEIATLSSIVIWLAMVLFASSFFSESAAHTRHELLSSFHTDPDEP